MSEVDQTGRAKQRPYRCSACGSSKPGHLCAGQASKSSDSEVLQGRTGQSSRSQGVEQSDSGYADNPGMAYCLDHKVIVPIGDHADCNKVASIRPSTVTDTKRASLPSNGGGSQDSIDPDTIFQNHALDIPFSSHMDDIRDCDFCKAALQNWHTQTAYQELLELIGDNTSEFIHLPGFQSNKEAARNTLKDDLRAAAKARYHQN